MVGIVDEESARAWLETQDHQTQVWFAARCALRAVPGLGAEPAATLGGIAFTSFRAMLISGAAGTCPAPEMTGLKSAAFSAAHSAFSAYSAARSAFPAAAAAAAYSADSALSARSAALSAVHSALSAADSSTAAYSAATSDGLVPNTWPKLWHAEDMPDGLADLWIDLRGFMEADREIWGFWLEWYEAILDGQPLDWELSFRIASELTDEDWEKGGEDWQVSARHVAGRIAEVRTAWDAEQKSVHEAKPESVEPKSMATLFDRAPTAQVTLASMSASISMGLDAFDRMSRPNEAVPMIDALRALPETAEKICTILQAGKTAQGAETVLALEVGRLRAKVARLETELRTAHSELAELRKKPWYRSAKIILPATTVGTIVSALWVLSGDDLALEDRWNKLATDLSFLSAEIWPETVGETEEPLRYELPDVFDV